MKPTPLLMGAALAAIAAAAPAARSSDGGSQALEVRDRVIPSFPEELLDKHVTEGYLRVAVGVDAAGRVDDCLPLAYSDAGFVRPTLACLRQWVFQPARSGGRPVATSTQVMFHFVDQGPVLVQVGGEEVTTWYMNVLWPRVSVAFRTYSLRDLDAIPRPLAAPAPAYPAELARAGHAGAVTVHFFIDPTGAVRLPSVDPGADPLLAPLAIAAVQRWRFEPPRRHRRPVQVLASQVFQFNPPKG